MFHFFYSFITLIIALFFMILGVVAILTSWFFSIREMLISFLMEHSVLLLLFGIGFFVIGSALAIHILFHSRLHYVKIRMGQNPVLVSENIVQEYLNSYWKELFPNKEVPFRLTFKKRKIQIIADLPYLPLESQKDLLQRIEQELNDLFREILGYRGELDLSVSFQKEKKR